MDITTAQPTSPSPMHVDPLIAWVSGIATQSVFLGIAYWALNTLSGPHHNTLIYGWTFVGIGAFLTGLIVGFLLERGASAIWTGFACALFPTLIWCEVAGRYSRNPIGWLLWVILFAPCVVLAVFGVRFGASINRRILIATVLIVLIITTMVVAAIAYYPQLVP